MNWNDLSDNARAVMRDLGGFSPTFHSQDREVKGYTMYEDGDPGKRYYTSSQLRKIAEGCTEVADWLDRRADQNNNP